jgi:hypothetical protein
VTSVLVDTFGHGAPSASAHQRKGSKGVWSRIMANARRYACAAVVGNDSESVEAKDLHDFGRRN